MAINHNVKEIVRTLKFKKKCTQAQLAKLLGVTPQYLSDVINGRAPFSEELRKRMHEQSTDAKSGEEKVISSGVSNDSHTILIPQVNLDVRGGLMPNDVTDTPEYTTALIPFPSNIAKKGDVAVPVYGDSMSPRYPHGTIVLLRHIEMWREYLELGAAYVLVLNDGRRILKEVRAGHDKDHFTLFSANPAYDPTEIHRSMVSQVFMVVLSARREAM